MQETTWKGHRTKTLSRDVSQHLLRSSSFTHWQTLSVSSHNLLIGHARQGMREDPYCRLLLWLECLTPHSWSLSRPHWAALRPACLKLPVYFDFCLALISQHFFFWRCKPSENARTRSLILLFKEVFSRKSPTGFLCWHRFRLFFFSFTKTTHLLTQQPCVMK